MAFAVNGLFIAGTIAGIDNENYVLAGIVGGLGLPFSLSRKLRNDLSMTLNYYF